MAGYYNNKLGKWIYKNMAFDDEAAIDDYIRKHPQAIQDNTGLSGFDDYWKKLSGSGLTTAERQSNEFSHNESILSWERSEQSADNAMERTRELRRTAIPDSVEGAQAAGVNPIFALTGGMSSAPGAVGQSQAASSAAPRSGGLADIAAVLSAISQAKKNTAEANLAQTQADRYNELTDTDIAEARQRISQMGNQMGNDSLRAASESMLNYATSENIRAMQPYNMEFQAAQSSKAKEEAALAGVKAAWDAGLINRGYLDELLWNLERDSNNKQSERELNNMREDMEYVEYVFKTGRDPRNMFGSGAGLKALLTTMAGVNMVTSQVGNVASFGVSRLLKK